MAEIGADLRRVTDRSRLLSEADGSERARCAEPAGAGEQHLGGAGRARRPERAELTNRRGRAIRSRAYRPERAREAAGAGGHGGAGALRKQG